MIVPGSPPTLWKVVLLAQSFSRCRVARDIWKSSQWRALGRTPKEPGSEDAKKPRPKTVPVPKITLVSPDNSATVTVLEEAQRLAKRRNLILVKIDDLDGKTQRPVYKLMDNIDILEESKEDTKDTDRTKQKKGTKLFYVSGKITDYDLQTKTKNMSKLLSKGHKVKIVITLDGTKDDNIQRIIEDAVRNNGSVQRMSSKKNVILLLISPLLKNDVPVNNKDETAPLMKVNEEGNT